MAKTYTFELPNGKVADVEGPDSLTQEQAWAAVQPQLGGDMQSSMPAAEMKPGGHPGMFGAAEDWLGNASEDVKKGTKLTAIGRALSAIGAKGTDYGNSEKVGDFMASPALGSIQAAQGATQIPQGRVIEGAGNVIGGAADAMQIPSAFMGGPGAVKGMQMVDKVIPQARRAGAGLEAAKLAAANVPIDTSKIIPIVERALEIGGSGKMKGRGAYVPKAMSDLAFALEDTNGVKGPMNFPEARDFASSLSRLSADEKMKVNGEMGGLVKQAAGEFAQANMSAAEQAGIGPKFAADMTEYRRAMQMQEMAKRLKGYGIKVGLGAAGIGTSYELAKILGLAGK